MTLLCLNRPTGLMRSVSPGMKTEEPQRHWRKEVRERHMKNDRGSPVPFAPHPIQLGVMASYLLPAPQCNCHPPVTENMSGFMLKVFLNARRCTGTRAQELRPQPSCNQWHWLIPETPEGPALQTQLLLIFLSLSWRERIMWHKFYRFLPFNILTTGWWC